MNTAPGASSDDPDIPPPMLDYRGPDKEWPEEPRIPNPAATRSLRCGLGLLGLVVLVWVAAMLPESVGTPLAAGIVVAWFVLIAMAIGFGITGLFRTREPGVAGIKSAVLGLVLGLAGVGLVILVVVGNSIVAGVYGPVGSYTRSCCANNLHQIGQACALYANDYNGSYPQQIEQLLWMKLGEWHFVCPGSNDVRATGATIDAIAADMANPGRCSYIYLAAGLTTATPANTPIACDRPENHAGKGIHVLYADGTTTWLDKQQAQAFFANLPATRPAQ